MSPSEETRRHFYEQPAFKGAAAVVALVAAVLALVGPLGDIFDGLFPGSPPPVSWVEVVLDTSAAMEREFDGETRLQAAAGAVGRAVKELNSSGLGLRRTATTCEGHSEQVVTLGSGHVDQVTEMTGELEPEGEGSIVDAVRGGLEQFNRKPISDGGPESRRMMIFTAGVSECPGGDPAREVAEALEEASIGKAKMELFALGATAAEEARLRRFKEALREHANVELHLPETREELNNEAHVAGERAGRANEILEEERDNGFYEQQ